MLLEQTSHPTTPSSLKPPPPPSPLRYSPQTRLQFSLHSGPSNVSGTQRGGIVPAEEWLRVRRFGRWPKGCRELPRSSDFRECDPGHTHRKRAGGYFRLKPGYYIHALGKKSRVAHPGCSGLMDCDAGGRLCAYDAIQCAPLLLWRDGTRRQHARHEDDSRLLPNPRNSRGRHPGSSVFS
jgi:hypothetical protein